VVTPHLGASTTEAQDKAGTAVARSVRLALEGEFVPDAVNVQAGGLVAEDVRPGLPLAEKLGRLFTAVAGGLAQSVNVDVRGKIAEFDVSVVQLAVLKGVFADIVEEQVTYVNAPLLADQRGLEVALSSDVESPDYRNLVSVRGAMADGTEVTVSGTLFGKNQVPKLTEVQGFDMDLDLSAFLLFFVYGDRPGVVGTVGAALGEAGINIAGAQVSRTNRGGEALMAVTVDSPVPPELLADIAGRIGAREARAADLTNH
jgi:D-3-phosphoglycerate dehydrogenase